MAGFSLGGGGSTRRNTDEEDQIAPENLFIYGSSTNPSSSNRGFELWQHQEIARQHHQFYSSAPTMLAFSSDDHPHNMAGPSGGAGGVNRRGSSSTSGGMSCQDCGNQAKKDCAHMRCRTCCKSRGFPCPTHVKSTWVPASRRRERQQQLALTSHDHHQQQQQQQQQQQSRDILSKRPREITTRLPGTSLANTGIGMEAVSFPAEVNSPAVFRCVRVSQMDEGEDEYAYQTAVNIGGHLFRGILYDQGPEQGIRGESSSTAAAVPTVAAITSEVITSSTVNVAGSGVMVDPSSVYPTPLNAFIAGTQFFPHHDPRS